MALFLVIYKSRAFLLRPYAQAMGMQASYYRRNRNEDIEQEYTYYKVGMTLT
jgi:hypothetical protein